MNVIVTGGTGFVGREVARSMLEAGHHVSVLARHPGSSDLHATHSKDDLRVIAGDITQPASLARALRGADAVVHLVGIISEVGESTFENVHVRGTQNLLAAATEQRVRRFVHMSALGTRPGAVSRYHQTKWAAEQAVRGSGLQWTIFRPSLIYGPQDQFVNLFARISRISPVLPIIGRRDARFQPVSVEVVAKAFTAALTRMDGASDTWTLSGPERLTLDEILDAILAVLGRRRLKVHVPGGIARLQARFMEWFFPLVLGQAPPLNRDQLIMLEEGNEGDGNPADCAFELQHFPFREGIRAYLRSAN